ncbi:MAG TPA: sigma-70 family RNA polymerase sigma factor [Longimicrobiales bacterium]|nr:sigma-70 family RNA polymerase sigma factor [Longimicrobiales bacterium]
MNYDHPSRSAVTTLLSTVDFAGSPALSQLMPMLYDELRELARRQLAREHRNVTLQPTELVHEAWLRLVDSDQVADRGRAYFFAAAGRAMRQVLIDAARRRGAVKRGGGQAMVTLDEGHAAVDAYASDLVELDDALQQLEQMNPRHARVVECRYFGGLSVEETAAALDVSARTVKSDWALARAWLYGVLRGAPPEPA